MTHDEAADSVRGLLKTYDAMKEKHGECMTTIKPHGVEAVRALLEGYEIAESWLKMVYYTLTGYLPDDEKIRRSLVLIGEHKREKGPEPGGDRAALGKGE